MSPVRAINQDSIMTLKKERMCHVPASHVQELHIHALI